MLLFRGWLLTALQDTQRQAEMRYEIEVPIGTEKTVIPVPGLSWDYSSQDIEECTSSWPCGYFDIPHVQGRHTRVFAEVTVFGQGEFVIDLDPMQTVEIYEKSKG